MKALFQAIINGDLNSVKAELENTWYGTVDENGLTGLHYAALYGQPEIGQLFIDAGLFVNRTTYDGKQPLHLAAQNYQDSMVDMLMENGAAIRAVDYDGNTPLHYAVESNPPPEFVQKLIDLGADVNSANNDGQTPLNFVETSDNSEVLVVFLNNGVVSDSLPALLQAVVDGDLPGVEAELGNAWYGATDLVGFTGLHYAAALGHPEIAQLFLDAGMFVNRTTFDGKQPLHIAAMAHETSMVDFLMSQGGAIKAVDYLGNTPLHYAVKNNPSSEFVGLLLSYGADINAKNNNGLTPLALVEDTAEEGLFLYLLENGATSSSISHLLAQAILGDVDGVTEALTHSWYGQTDKHGMTGVHFAAEYGHPEVAQLFLDKGVFVNQTTYDGLQSLHIAAQFSQGEMVDYLMDHGAAIRAVDFEGNTPLHYAVTESASLEVVAKLLGHGADIHTQNNEGLSALDLAQDSGNSDLVALLEDGVIAPLITSQDDDIALTLSVEEEEPVLLVEPSENSSDETHILNEADLFEFNLDDLLNQFKTESKGQDSSIEQHIESIEPLAQPPMEVLPEHLVFIDY